VCPPGSPEHGKIAEALWVTSQWPDEIEADLQRYYGIRYGDLFLKGTGLTWRRLLVLLHHLPSESAVNTAIRNSLPESELARQSASSDPAKGKWSTVETLLAALIDEVRYGNWAFVQAYSKDGVTRPTPIRRPGLARTGKAMTLEQAQQIDPRLRGMSVEQAQEWLDRLHGHGKDT